MASEPAEVVDPRGRMTRPTQSATHRCDYCGRQMPVVPVTRFEFDWTCACGMAGTISWAHAAAPPACGPPDAAQMPLAFADAGKAA